MDLYNRVSPRSGVSMRRAGGQDVIAVGHGGTIKAADWSSARGQPDKGLAFDIDNCSVTRLDHIATPKVDVWRLPMVNQRPWMAAPATRRSADQRGPRWRQASWLDCRHSGARVSGESVIG